MTPTFAGLSVKVLENDPIRNMLAIGAVSPRSARVWLRVEQPGIYQLCWTAIDNQSAVPRQEADSGSTARSTLTLRIDDRQADLTASTTLTDGLTPDTRYRVVLVREGGEPLASGGFVTAPAGVEDEPDHFSIALLSCHQPFSPDGAVAPSTAPMLEAVNRAFEMHRVRAVVMGGDQLYSDFPAGASLFESGHFAEVAPAGRADVLECSEEEVRQLFQQRYRHFWNIEGWRELLASYPSYPILDDHEIVDNWGSASEHSTERWQAFRRGAFQAYADYQGSRVCEEHARLPECFDYEFQFAGVACHVMDLRSNRCTGEHAQLVSPTQFQRFESFLHRHRRQHTLLVVLSVPLLHLPRALCRLAARLTPDGEDFSDRWSTHGHRRDRDRLLRILHDHQMRHPEQRLVLLSGDIHIGCVHEIRWRDGKPRLYQFVSSGVTHDVGRFIQGVSSAIIRANRSVTTSDDRGPRLTARLRLLRGETEAHDNPCGRLNVGIVEFRRPDDAPPGTFTAPDMRFLLYSHDGPQPRCLFRSRAIPAEQPATIAAAADGADA